MSDVFLSYSKEDGKTASLISEKLTTAGFSVWWDRHIMPGKTWDEVIGASLDSAACVVVLWSKTSVQSRWVREEAERGADRLVPIFIEKVKPPLGFAHIEAADLSEWQGEATNSEFTILCEAIGSLLKTPRKPVEVVPAPNPQPAASAAAAPAAAAPVVNQAPIVNPAPFANPAPPPLPFASAQFFVGRWRVEGFNGSDITYWPNGAFNGVMAQGNVFGRWNVQVLGPSVFQLQLWFANMNTWMGTFQILDWDHLQGLEGNYIVSRIR